MPDQTLYLGVDGGGSTCRARLCDAAGAVRGEARGGPANLRLGAGAVVATVHGVCETALAAAGPHERQRCRAGVGLAGVGREPRPPLPSGLAEGFAALTLRHDAHIACLGAHRGEPGAVLIVGTGSCAHLVDEGAEGTTLGGLGFALSDQGSGAWLGRRALRAALLALDALGPSGALSEQLLAQFGRRPFDYVDWAESAHPADYAQLAPLVFACAAAGDPTAIAIRDAGAAALRRLVRALLARGAKRLSVLGGLAASYRPHLGEDIAERISAPRGDALDGALLLAGLPAEHLPTRADWTPGAAP